jgi:hypothetical protein
MVRFVRFGPRLLPLAAVGALLASLGGCAAVPLGQMAYQAATAPTRPCVTPGNPAGCGTSGLTSMWDGLKGGLAAR